MTILIGIMAGLVGSAYWLYGKRAGNMRFMACGVLLCVYPYFTGNVWVTLAAGTALCAFPFVFPEN